MKKTLKSLFSVLVVIAFVFAFAAPPKANAQTFVYRGDLTTSVVPIGASNTPAHIITAAYSTSVGIGMGFNLTGAGTAGVTFRIDSSNDGQVWKTDSHRFWLPANGTTQVATNYTVTMGGIPYLRLSEIHNTNSIAVTNLWFSYNAKRGI